jgi:hypothetical protein
MFVVWIWPPLSVAGVPYKCQQIASLCLVFDFQIFVIPILLPEELNSESQQYK